MLRRSIEIAVNTSLPRYTKKGLLSGWCRVFSGRIDRRLIRNVVANSRFARHSITDVSNQMQYVDGGADEHAAIVAAACTKTVERKTRPYESA